MPTRPESKSRPRLFGRRQRHRKHLRDDQHSYEVVGIVPDMKDAGGMTIGIAYLPLTRHDFATTPAAASSSSRAAIPLKT